MRSTRTGLPASAITKWMLSPVEISLSAAVRKASFIREIARSMVRRGFSASSERVTCPT